MPPITSHIICRFIKYAPSPYLANAYAYPALKTIIVPNKAIESTVRVSKRSHPGAFLKMNGDSELSLFDFTIRIFFMSDKVYRRE